MMETTGKQHWYVARTRTNQEYIIKAKLEALGVEHFLPEGFRTRETAGREKPFPDPEIFSGDEKKSFLPEK